MSLWRKPGPVAACVAFLVAGAARPLAAGERIDYPSEIQPIFLASCSGAFCHIDQEASGVDLTDYRSVLESTGFQYGVPIVLPGRPDESPLWDKVAHKVPAFGRRMPLGEDPLAEAEIERIRRWIEEGARPAGRSLLRGDFDESGRYDITDPIALLGFLFQGGGPARCEAIADVDGDGIINITDPIYLLGFLFLGGPEPAELSPEEEAACLGSNRPPVPLPIGTVVGREGVPLEFHVHAADPDGDRLFFSGDALPAGAEVEAATGVVRWTPGFGETGDHRIRIRVTDAGIPPLEAVATGLIRIVEGNHPPYVEAIGTRYGREGVLLDFTVAARDDDGDALEWELLDGPDGSELDAASGRFRWTSVPGDAGEHALRVRVSDGGTPPRAAESSGTLVIVSEDAPVNQPPIVPSREVYRTYPGREVSFAVGAADPDGHALSYRAATLPAGAELDEASGVFTWVPDLEQVGPAYVPFAVTDDGLPPETTEDVLILQVLPPDLCADITCDPETGCTATLVPLSDPCCEAEPDVRAAEPVAGCPEARVLHAGRNRRGFGRLQNCDLLPVTPFAQGGATVRFHIEARCIDTSRDVTLRARLQTLSSILFDRQRTYLLQERSDGFAQRLAIVFDVDPAVPISQIEGAPALFSLALTDRDGVVLRRELRVVLTLADPPDLPEPDLEDVPAGEGGCVGCHRPRSATGERHGIEEAHPWHPLACTDCHGGNASATTREAAHVQPPDGIAYLRDRTSDQLDRASTFYLQFVNPGDLRVARRGCGAGNPASGGSGCHQSIVDALPLSVMSTYVGHYTLPRFLAGSQERTPIFGAVDRTDPDFDPATAPEGALATIAALREPDPAADRAALGTCIDVYLPKSCPTCHLSDFGRNNAAGNYRSSGCTACHMVYADDGLSRSDDPVVPKDFPPHPVKHTLTSAIPTEQCAHCHFQGGRIGLAYRGIREGGFSPERTPPNAVPLGRELHAHDAGYYFVDEDSTNRTDETPPDVHHTAGMACADCHVGADVHGDGNLYASERYQVGIRCEDCHGTVRAVIEEDPRDGLFKNSRGSPLRALRRTEDGRILLRLRMDGREIEVPQIHRILESGINLAMEQAMGVDARGFSHTDTLECYACHTSWRQTCFGCHITVDDGRSQLNLTTGLESQGGISVTRDTYSLDFFALGMNHRGKVTPLCSSMSILMTYIDEQGKTRYRDRVRTSFDGRTGFGWNPFHHHTVSRVPENCDRCHPVAPGAGSDNTAVLRETYGFGNGDFMLRDGDGVEHDASAFLDEDGNLIAEFPHPGTGPVPPDVRARALSTEVVPHPRR